MRRGFHTICKGLEDLLFGLCTRTSKRVFNRRVTGGMTAPSDLLVEHFPSFDSALDPVPPWLGPRSLTSYLT